MPIIKDDSNKPLWHILPMDSVEEVVKVFTFGAKKYKVDGWRTDPSKTKDISAAYRHLKKHLCGEYRDKESNLPHLAHAIAGLLISLTKYMEEEK